MIPYVLVLFLQIQGQHLKEVKRVKNISTLEECTDRGHAEVEKGKDLNFVCFSQDTYFRLPKW
ncbi:MAG: hypothetical protein ACYDHY_06640 [Acidiferrobacterales bacterium]